LVGFRISEEVSVNKSELIDAISRSTSLAKREAEDAVNALVHTVVGEVRSGRRVVVAGFGSFNPTHRGARVGRNPQTGAAVKIKASRGVRFAASTTLKNVVNGKSAMPKLKSAASPAAKSSGAKTAKAAKSAKSVKKVAPRSTRKSAVGAPRRAPAKKSPAKQAATAKRPATKATKKIAKKTTKKTAKKIVRRAPAR
jgi:DNA-binding protein HU-beta